MDIKDFIFFLNENYDENIEIVYHNPQTQDVVSAHFAPVEHGKEYCSVSYIDTRNAEFYRFERPVCRHELLFKLINGLEDLLKKGTITCSASHVNDVFFENKRVYKHKYSEKILSVEKKKSQNEKKKGVYVINAGKYIKIGVTTDFTRRINSMQTSSAETFELICFFDGASYKFESELHEKFKKNRVRGEWFSSKIKERILNLHSNYTNTQHAAKTGK